MAKQSDAKTDDQLQKNDSKGKSTKKVASNSVRLDPDTPIPIEFNSNIFVSLKGKQYVPFLNPKDTFGQLLTEAKTLSPTTFACVSSKATYKAGRGLYVVEGEMDKDLEAWGKSVNRKQQSIKEIIKQAFEAIDTAGNTFIEVVKGSIGGKKFVRVHLRSYLDCRLSLPDDDDICNTVYYSKYFRHKSFWNMKFDEVSEVPIYNPGMLGTGWAKDDKGNMHTMFHLKNEVSGYEYYGMPSNVGTLPEQILEYKAVRYNLDEFDNNLVIGGIVVIKGTMPNEEAEKVASKLVYQHTGDGKRGRFMVLSSEAGLGEGVTIENFEKQKEGSFIESDQHNEEKIYIGNNWNKLLIGGSENKNIGSGNSAYIRSVFDIANSTVIGPAQEYMITKFIEPLMQICDEHLGTKWAKLPLGIKQIQPLSFLGDIDVNGVLTKNEGREILGHEPLLGPEGELFIKSGSAPDANAVDPNKNPNV